ncbi:unnamed protein product, partial [Durusdinium trenchii]
RWKYNSKIWKHWYEVEETGELSNSTTNIKREEDQRPASSPGPLRIKKLRLKPPAVNGPEAGESDKEHGESPERSNEKDSVAEVEKEDHIFGH